MISAFLTALAGTFYTQYIYFIDPQTAFNFNISIEAALVSIVGGVGTLWGPVIGTVLLETTSALLQSWLGNSIGGVQLTVYSLILMAVILWRPTGIMGYLAEVYGAVARRRRGVRQRWPTRSSSGSEQALRRPARRAGRQLHGAGKRDAGVDRAERRRQDHQLQPDHRLLPARYRFGASPSAGKSSACGRTTSARTAWRAPSRSPSRSAA